MSAAGPGEALAAAMRVADAVLYEGYVLFPYRASAAKNRYRWQFGVVVPAAQAEAEPGEGSEPAEVTSQTLLRAGSDARVTVVARFLTLLRRQVQCAADGGWQDVDECEVDGRLHTSWDEGVERQVRVGPVSLGALVVRGTEVPFSLERERGVEVLRGAEGTVAGRVERVAEPVSGLLQVRARRLDEGQPPGAGIVRLEVVVRNTTGWADAAAPREVVLRRSLVGLHLLLSAEAGSFASLTDPPGWAAGWVKGLDNRHTYPVLAGAGGRADVVLSAPIILPDHPEVAGESPGDSYDATEIDELLTLAVRSLTEEEKRQARATDPRAAGVVDRAESLPPEMVERLHGAIRQFEPLQDFFGAGERPPEDVEVGGRTFRVGDRMRLRPRRRADAQDLFVEGRIARLERIETDLEGQVHLAVTLTDDPGADLHAWSRRFLYFQPDEVELLNE